MKYLANMITVMRIVGALCLFLCEPFSTPFWMLYFLCGLSDMTDGLIARRTNSQSRLGALLDSIADLVFLISVWICIGAQLWKTLPKWSLYAAAIVAVIKIAAYGVGYFRFHRFAALHTILNKLTGGLLFCLPYLLPFSEFSIYLAVVCGTAFLAAAEEFICMLLSVRYDADRKGILFDRRDFLK